MDRLAPPCGLAVVRRSYAEFPALLGIHVALILQYLCRLKMADLVARSKHSPPAVALDRVPTGLARDGSRVFPRRTTDSVAAFTAELGIGDV